MGEHPAEHKGRRVVVARTLPVWRDWLLAEGATSDAVWLTVWKQAAGPGMLTYDDVVEEALCHGWIDSTINAFDGTSYLLLVARRKPRSVWSAPNKERVVRMVAEGRMLETGRAAIDAAVADGSWTILDPVEALEEPDDLAAALDAEPARREAWDASRPGRRKQALYRLVLAKTAATRQKRLDEILAALAEGPLPA